MEMKYLDNNSTTKMDERVLEVMLPYFSEVYGNPSSIHAAGQKSRKVIEDARMKITELLKIQSSELIFTSGGTESNNMAISGVAKAYENKGKHIITSCIEHPSVLNVCKDLEKEGYEITYLNVNSDGIIDLEQLKSSIKSKTILITIMHANNEIGTIQPIFEIGEIAKQNKIFFHVDAVQSIGKINFDIKANNIDLLSFSAHKFYGPKGIGALYVKNGIKLSKLVKGGHQERNRRAGTENVPGIVGMAKALELAYENIDQEFLDEKELRDYFEHELKERIPEIIINGDPEKRLSGTTSVTIKYVEGESILLNLDMKGVAVSSGSACTSGSLEPSHVVLAIGVPMKHAHGTLRFSLGRFNNKADIDYVLEVLPDIVAKIRSMSPFWNN